MTSSPPTAPKVADEGHPHLIAGEFQSDKYPTCPRGKVPLSVKDKTAQDLLWEYAQRRRAVDAEFATDLEIALQNAGYGAPDPKAAAGEEGRVLPDECPDCHMNWRLFPPANHDDYVLAADGSSSWVPTNGYHCVQCKHEWRVALTASRSDTIRADTVEACAKIVEECYVGARPVWEVKTAIINRIRALSTATPAGETEGCVTVEACQIHGYVTPCPICEASTKDAQVLVSRPTPTPEA